MPAAAEKQTKKTSRSNTSSRKDDSVTIISESDRSLTPGMNDDMSGYSITTPLSSTSSSGSSSIKSNMLPYQYRGKIRIENLQGPLRSDLGPSHRTMRIGLGTPMTNLKASQIINSKKSIDNLSQKSQRKIIPLYSLRKLKAGGGDSDIVSSALTNKMQKLTIYESPKSRKECGGTKGIRDNESVFDIAFKSISKKANSIAFGNKVTFTLENEEEFTSQNKLSKAQSCKKEHDQSILKLCRQFRSLLGWKMSLYIKWNYLEDRVKRWPSLVTPYSVKEIAEALSITADQLRGFQIKPDIKKIFHFARKNLSHVAFPNITKALAISELQKGDSESAGRYISESNGMFLQSEIIDKHLNYIRRNEELNPTTHPAGGNEQLKTEIFLDQVKLTLEFSNSIFATNGEKEFRKLSSFNKDWNVIQISTSIISTNRFGRDLIGMRHVPQLFLSSFCFVPGQTTSERYHFTTSCLPPKVEPSCLMRSGIVEEFQKLLDRNLAISDEATIISRKKYWEERARHNDTIEGIMEAMQDWIYPWSFLLPGTVKDEAVQFMISSEIMTDSRLKKATDCQKLLIHRLTENYNLIPIVTRVTIDTLIAYILEINEDEAEILARKIGDVGSSICVDAERNPTILVLDQEIDILPWDWLPCIRTTDVSRMPSLNVMYSAMKMSEKINCKQLKIVNPEKCTFILNPDGTLPQVQKRLENYFTERKGWNGVVGRSPSPQEMQEALENQDILLYCGHGAGSSFYPEYAVQKLVCKAVPLLMGCSSAQSHYTGPRLYANSSIHAYFIAACPSAVGFLWEITDTECDRVTVDFLERWVPDANIKPPKMPFFDCEFQRQKENCLAAALRKSRTSATQLLTQCAAVCYGLPTVFTK